jgi:hypothetical protein
MNAVCGLPLSAAPLIYHEHAFKGFHQNRIVFFSIRSVCQSFEEDEYNLQLFRIYEEAQEFHFRSSESKGRIGNLSCSHLIQPASKSIESCSESNKIELDSRENRPLFFPEGEGWNSRPVDRSIFNRLGSKAFFKDPPYINSSIVNWQMEKKKNREYIRLRLAICFLRRNRRWKSSSNERGKVITDWLNNLMPYRRSEYYST